MKPLTDALGPTETPLRVLFVDDEERLLNATERALGDYFEVHTANSGDEALRRIDEAGDYSLIVADQWMPGMNGVELIDKIRRAAPDTPCLLMTGDPADPTVRRCVADGRALGLLEKPSPTAEIVRAVLAIAATAKA